MPGEVDAAKKRRRQDERVHGCANVVAEAGQGELGRAATTAGAGSPLVDLDPKAGARQCQSSRQPVRARSDDNGIRSGHGGTVAAEAAIRGIGGRVRWRRERSYVTNKMDKRRNEGLDGLLGVLPSIVFGPFIPWCGTAMGGHSGTDECHSDVPCPSPNKWWYARGSCRASRCEDASWPPATAINKNLAFDFVAPSRFWRFDNQKADKVTASDNGAGGRHLGGSLRPAPEPAASFFSLWFQSLLWRSGRHGRPGWRAHHTWITFTRFSLR